MEQTTETNAVNPDLKEMHDMVTHVKNNKEVTLAFMKIFEKEQLLIQEGIQQGIQQGHDDMKKEVEKERQRAEAAEAEVQKLREELARLGK